MFARNFIYLQCFLFVKAVSPVGHRTFDRIRFIDSLSFFQMPLSAFPKTFGLTELKKGYFLHLFNIPENQEYVGSIPEKHYYMPESMSVSGRKNFEKWYDEQVAKNVEFDFQNELVEYCESDVKLLKQGCLTFKRVFEKAKRQSLTRGTTSNGFRLQSRPASEPYAAQHHCFRTLVRMEHEDQSVQRCTGMVVLARTLFSEDHRSIQSHSTYSQQGRIQNLQQSLQGRWLRRTHQHHL